MSNSKHASTVLLSYSAFIFPNEIKYILPVFPALLVYVAFNLMSHPALYFYLYRYSTCTCIATFILNTVISIPFGNFEN